MNNIFQFSECANCGACYNACPVQAITVDKNSMFYELKVDKEKCINCGECIKVCPWNNETTVQHLIAAYGGWHNNKDVIAHSSSGGAFTAIAEHVLNEHGNGIVFGAVYSDDKHEILFGSTENYTLDEIRRSKYVESSVGNSFSEVKKHLINGRKVLFCAAPCQIAGLKRYLEKDYDNLITCDFACGGLPSHDIYHRYLCELEKRYHSKVKEVNFRPKVYGWEKHAISILFENGKRYTQLASIDPYFYSFVYRQFSTRDNCWNCKFKNNHYSDLILADFWKYRDISNLKNAYNGISLVLVNSSKGQKVIDAIQNVMTLKELNLEKASYNFNRTSHSLAEINQKAEFVQSVKAKGLDKAAADFGMPVGIQAIKKKKKVQLRLIAFKLGIKKP